MIEFVFLLIVFFRYFIKKNFKMKLKLEIIMISSNTKNELLMIILILLFIKLSYKSL